MMKDGYDEKRVIPIAISKAKEWYENASSKDKKDLKKKDITEHKKTSSNARELQDSDIIVKYRDEDNKWEVRSKGAQKPDSLHDRKVDAENRDREISKYRECKVISYKKNKN